MTDKEKFHKEVEKLKSNLIYGACSSQIAMETMCKEEAYNEVLALLDTMQEEPISIWHDASKKSDNPEDVVIINPSDNTGEVLTKCTGVNQGHIWAYTSELLKLDNPCNIGKNLQEPQVKESAEIQHVNETCKENGNSLTKEPVSNVWHRGDEFKDIEYQRICKKVIGNMENKRFAIGDVMEVENGAIDLLYEDGCIAMCIRKEDTWAYLDDLLNLSNVQKTVKDRKEPVSEVLCAADSNSYKYIESVRGAAIQAFEDGAKWQEEKDNEEKVFTYKHGFNDCKEQMMAKAVDGEVTYGKSLAIPSLGWVLDKEGLDYGDKVKLIIIKEK